MCTDPPWTKSRCARRESRCRLCCSHTPRAQAAEYASYDPYGFGAYVGYQHNRAGDEPTLDAEYGSHLDGVSSHGDAVGYHSHTGLANPEDGSPFEEYNMDMAEDAAEEDPMEASIQHFSRYSHPWSPNWSWSLEILADSDAPPRLPAQGPWPL